jgi:hypothetical protein
MNFNHTRTIFLAVFTLSAATACNALMPSALGNFGAQAAENPIKGQPVHWSAKANGVPFEGQTACTTWPIENELTVSATADQICVKGHMYSLLGAEFPAPNHPSLGIASDGSGDSGLVAGQASSVEAKGVRKIGQCTDHNNLKSVWEEPYDACVANKDPNGKPALTAQSTFLRVGDAKWKFAAPESSAKAASAK